MVTPAARRISTGKCFLFPGNLSLQAALAMGEMILRLRKRSQNTAACEDAALLVAPGKPEVRKARDRRLGELAHTKA